MNFNPAPRRPRPPAGPRRRRHWKSRQRGPWAFFCTFAVTSGNILWKFRIFKFRMPNLIFYWHHKPEAEMHHETKPNDRKRSVNMIRSKPWKYIKCATMNARKSSWDRYQRFTWRHDTMIERSAVENHTQQPSPFLISWTFDIGKIQLKHPSAYLRPAVNRQPGYRRVDS